MTISQKLALEVARALYRTQTEGYPLRQLFWECTLRCNFACRHCGSDCTASSTIQDMPFEDFQKVLLNIKEHTDPSRILVMLSGGEPLSRKDLEECGLKITQLGFPWGLVTNGWGLTPQRFTSLMDAGMRSLTISLDGLKEDHDWMRGKPGAFERASSAIQTAASCTGLNFDVVTCVNRRSIAQLEDIKEYLISLGLKNWRLFTIFPVGRAANDPELQLTAEEFRTLMEFIKNARKEGRIHASYACENFLSDYEGLVRDNFYFCNAGISVASIRVNGDISSCLSIRSDYNQGNIYKDDFWTVWTTKFQPYRDRSWMKTGKCAECKFWRYCQGGPMHLRDDRGQQILCRAKPSK